MKRQILFLITFIYCISCANPTIVNVIGPNDNSLNCFELSKEIAIANKYADEAKEANLAYLNILWDSYKNVVS